MSARWILATLALWLGFAGVAHAHESRPLYIEITERGGDVFAMQWRTPASVPEINLPDVTLPACESASPVGTTRGTGGHVSQRLYHCDEGLAGAALEIRYPLLNPSVSTLLRITWESGESRSVLASPKEAMIALPAPETTGGVAGEYFVLGVEHILLGCDHLLFVACLVLIAGTLRRVLVTITGFTIAHSITLALAALQLVRVPVPPVEATIALSIVFVATELVKARRQTLTWRYPIAVSASFGLLHGFGFATVLSEIGLPQTEVPTALLFFNVGVEAGQIAFVALVFTALLAARTIRSGSQSRPLLDSTAMRRLQRPIGYAVGGLASYWVIERVSGFWI